ncbi:Uncharacterized protein APZ42_020841 [Daphnia magna]|uniref:Uncharacterized protein n=1 Tax=Daphnia magna TaxID=35525 RepID=A0A164XFQ0_9CRUS|nr:Uncharacterized protein APZ42_020841 [Daphnia magna]
MFSVKRLVFSPFSFDNIPGVWKETQHTQKVWLKTKHSFAQQQKTHAHTAQRAKYKNTLRYDEKKKRMSRTHHHQTAHHWHTK